MDLKTSISLKASTLIETLIALVIVTISFGVGITIFLNVTSSSNYLQKAKAKVLLEEQLSKTIYSKKYEHLEFSKDNIQIQQEVTFYKNFMDVVRLQLVAKNEQNQVLIEINQLVNIRN